MKIDNSLICPKCKGTQFTVKQEATYLYSYKLDTSNKKNRSRYDEPLPFLFDNREKINGKEYLECDQCGAKYSYDINKQSQNIHLTILQKAVRADHQTNPEFLG